MPIQRIGWGENEVRAVDKRGIFGDRTMLTDARVRSAKPRQKAYKIADANRLFLMVTPSGGMTVTIAAATRSLVSVVRS
jgi:hypothetical protein